MTKFMLYHYDPSTPAAVVFIVLFSITTFLHNIQVLKTKTWYFTPFIIGGLFETTGYLARLISSTQSPHWATEPSIIQSLLLLLAPALLAASIYMVLSRLIKLVHAQKQSLISTRWFTTVFVSGDDISFLSQSAGGAMLAKAKTNSRTKLGQHIIIAGLTIQILFMNLFIFITYTFHRRINLHPTSRSKHLKVPWKRMLWILYLASGLIAARSGFSIVEYLQGSDGYLMRHEVFLYVFDASLMWIVMWIFNVWHPSVVLRKGKGRGRRHRRSGYGSDRHKRSRQSRHTHGRSYNSHDVETPLEYPGAVYSKH